VDVNKAAIDSKINQLSKLLGRINEVKKELRQSKIMIVGEGSAGKTAFANSIIGKKFKETESTVGIDSFICSVTHAALSKSEWKKCDKIEKEYENAIAEHLSKVDIKNEHLTQQESSQMFRKKDGNGLDTRMVGNFDDLKSDAYAADHHGKGDGTTFAHSKGEVLEEDEVDLGHSKGDSLTDGIDQSSHAKVDEDMIVKYLANHVEVGSNILINIFDYGGQTVFNVSTMFIYIIIILFTDNSVNHITVF
jgi:GTPase SAR1 family protein